MHRKIALSREYHVTLITGIAECVRKMLGLHMIPCARTVLVGEFVTQRAVELLISQVFSHKL